MAGGYDIDRLPFTVAPLPGESLLSWITATAARYECTPVQLFRAIGLPLPSKSPRRVVDHAVANMGRLAAATGLTDEQTNALSAPTPLDLAVSRYRELYTATGCGLTPTSRHCPTCLAETGGRWAVSWANPLHLVCVAHRAMLVSRCPVCGGRPWSGPGWIITRTGGRRCPDYTARESRPLRRTLRPRCDHDFTIADPTSRTDAGDDLIDAQQLLLDLAREAVAEQPAVRFACGVTVSSSGYFNAMMELIDEAGAFDNSLGTARGGIALAAAMSVAACVLTQPSTARAAEIADRHRLLNPAGRHTPISLPALRRGVHHPLLLSVRLSTVVPHMSPTDQLTFLAAATLPRPPPRYRSEHDQPLNDTSFDIEIPFTWLPHQLWRGAISDSIAGLGRFPRVAAVIVLARLGSDRTWAHIVGGLGLPSSLEGHARGFLYRLRHTGRWPTFLRDLTGLAEQLSCDPPPIDYAQRRNADAASLSRAVASAAYERGGDLTDAQHSQLTRQFWALYTGGDLRNVPTGIAPDADSRPYGFEILNQPVSATLDRAFYLLRHTHRCEPFTWRPTQPRAS